ncbi:MAG: DUF4340 domain-containing protein [Sedimentisphaerales bacterium]
MSNKKLIVLGVLAAAAIAGAVLVSQMSHRSKQSPAGQGSNLIQGLDPAGIAQITIGPLGAGKGEQIVLKRKDKNFVVVNKSYYPASNRAINDLIASCLDIRIVELYTQDEKNFKDLGVTEETGANVVKFFDSNGKIITGVITGLTREKDGMAYGRLVNDNKVYVIYNTPAVIETPIEYVEQGLVSVDKANIESVIVSTPKTAYTLIGEANGTEVKLKELPAGKKEKKQECAMVFDAIANLRFDDVNAATETAYLDFNQRWTCQLKDSTLYTIEIAQDGSKTFAKCSVDFLDKTQVTKEQGVESQEELKKKEAKLLAKDKAIKFKNTCEGWVYHLPEYEAKSLIKPMAELIEDEKPADANEPKDKG